MERASRVSREGQGHPGTFLARASRLLASSLEYEETLRTVAGLALPDLGAWCIVDIVEHEDDEPVMRRLAIVHPDEEKEEITHRLEKSWPPETEDPIGAPVVLRTRKSEVVSHVTDEMLRRAARSEANLRDLRQLRIGSFMVVPLIARGEMLGAVTFISPTEGEEYAQQHLDLAENLAAVCALAIDNARHYRSAVQAKDTAGSERHARHYAEAIVDTVREPLLILDSDLRVVTANRSFCRMFAISSEEAAGRIVYDIGHGDWNNPPLRKLLDEIIHEQTELDDFEIEQTFEALGRRTLLLNARSIRRRRGEDSLILLAMEDVTERKQASEERERLLEREHAAREEAERAVRARQKVLGIVSHDLRSPLNVISASAQFLQMLPPDQRGEKEEERFSAIVRAADRMDRLIGDLLDMSRIEAGSFSVEEAPTDAGALVDEAEQVLRPRAELRSIDLRCDVPENLPRIWADRDRLFQVFENLIGNAIKFSSEGSRVTLRAQERETEVQFSITDNGPGIPEANLQQLFDPFWQAEGATKSGAGLGLFISKSIVGTHGGEIWVESRLSEGTTFHFTIPKYTTENA